MRPARPAAHPTAVTLLRQAGHPPYPLEIDMTRYADAYHQARQWKTAGVTQAKLHELADRYDNDGWYGAAEAFRKVASE